MMCKSKIKSNRNMKKALPTSYLKNSVMNFKDFIIVIVEHNEINIWGFSLFVTPCFPVNQ